MASIAPLPKGMPVLEVGPVKSTKCPIAIFFAKMLLIKKNASITLKMYVFTLFPQKLIYILFYQNYHYSLINWLKS